MSIKDFLFGKPRPHQPLSGQKPRQPLTLSPAPAYQPLPARPMDSWDAKVSELWRLYQRDHHAADWTAFVRDLEVGNAERAQRLAEIKKRLADYPSNNRFVK